MSHVIVIASFKLNDENLLNDWKELSATIDKGLSAIDGFLSRDSAIGDDANVYCLVKWKSKQQEEAFMKHFEESDDLAEMTAEFERIVKMDTMTREVLEVI